MPFGNQDTIGDLKNSPSFLKANGEGNIPLRNHHHLSSCLSQFKPYIICVHCIKIKLRIAAGSGNQGLNLYCILISWLKCSCLDTRSWEGEAFAFLPLLSYLLLWPTSHRLQRWGFGKYTICILESLPPGLHPSLNGTSFLCRKLSPLCFHSDSDTLEDCFSFMLN